jgi:8-amino-7-oxononanoate synthase
VKQLTPPGLAFLDGALEDARDRGLLRERGRFQGALTSFCSNDYLGLARQTPPCDHAGAGASRLVDGDRPIHARLEEAAAHLVGQPSALVFTSGYAANVGLVSALAGPGDLIVSDALNHASLIDGARLSRARIQVVPHLDVAAVIGALKAHRAAAEPALEGRRAPAAAPSRAFVLTESYFSMDADSPDLPALRRACDDYGAALVVDEAHALGVLGPDGRGLCVEAGVRADAIVGTFGKAFGAGGAFVAGCPALSQWLWNRARSFVFSTGLSPALTAAALQGIATARAEPDRRRRTLAAASRLREGLQACGVLALGYGHVVPWVVGDEHEALRVSSVLAEHGMDVRAIRPPSVPQGTARLRLTVSAAHGDAEIDGLVAAVRAVTSGLTPGHHPGTGLAGVAGALPQASRRPGG